MRHNVLPFVGLSAAFHVGIMALALLLASGPSAPLPMLATDVYIVARGPSSLSSSGGGPGNGQPPPARAASQAVAAPSADRSAAASFSANEKPPPAAAMSGEGLDGNPEEDPEENRDGRDGGPTAAQEAFITGPVSGSGEGGDGTGTAAAYSGGGQGGGYGTPGAAAPGYMSLLTGIIHSNVYYPLSARRLQMEGRVVTVFSINRDGAAEGIKVKSSSGHDALDRAALKIIERSLPLPAPPGGRLTVEVPLVFSLRGSAENT